MNKFSCKGCGKCCNFDDFLPLYFFEVDKIRNLDESLEIKPTTVFRDNKTGKLFAVTYGLFAKRCPFLNKNNRCNIYQIRPFVCRAYPLFWLPENVKSFNLSCFGKCPNFNHEEFLESSEDVKEVYEECYNDCKNTNEVNLFLRDMMIDLSQKGKIEPVQVVEFEDNIMPFFDYLVSIGELDPNKRNKLISKFNNLK